MRCLVYLLAGVLCAQVSQAAEPVTITVAADGSGDHTSVQAAIDAVPENNSTPHVIVIKPGVYKERLLVPKNRPFVTFRGDTTDPREVVLTYDLYASMKDPATGQDVGTSGSASSVIDGANFTAENVTFENSAGDVGQAVAIRIMSDRVVFRNCRFLGWQDTLYANSHGRNYFVDCYIEGRVDFIFGRSTAVFERCHIHSKNGGYVTAASTPEERQFGYVFLRCKLTGEGAPAYLGRPWRPYAAVAFLECEMGDHIRPEGWDNWRNPENEKTARYAEYRNTGSGADASKRVPWVKLLTDEEAVKYTTKNVLSGEDGWDPRYQLGSASLREAKVRIVLAGDSTVTNDAGWGVGFAEAFGDDVTVINLSRGGRSSKSFYNEGLWTRCLELKPDYVLIQFGHNDEPGKGLDRETDPDTTYRQNMKRYVEQARAAGVQPVLVTSLSRRQWNADGTIRSSLVPYANVVREIASEMNVPLIDLHDRSIEVYQSLGREGCERISPPKEGGFDGTHLNKAGSDLFGPLVAAELAKVIPALRPHLRLGR